jgi:lipopolysaccharide heptosyltransferase II
VKALVVCTGGGIGDVLLATPAMRALGARYEQVVALTSPAHRDVLANQPALREVWTDDIDFAAQAARIRAEGFDAAIVTWATLRSAALPFVGGVPVRVGQARRLYSSLFNKRVSVRSERGDRSSHWTQILLDFARALDCDVEDASPSFPVTTQDREEAQRLLAARGVDGPFALLHPTRGISGAAAARWPTVRLGELGRAVAERSGARLLVTGSSQDAALAAAVARGAGGISLAGATSLGAFAALAEASRGVVAMDSGPMHVAAAVGAPTVGIFALRSDEPERWAPLGPRTAIVRGTYPCPPGHRKETCPDFACVAQLDVARVVDALGGLLAGGAEVSQT